LTGVYPDVTVEAVRAATGWPLKVADSLEALRAPDPAALACLRDLHARTNAAHAKPVGIRLGR
jgi:glutaconate CoA-transferase, subunit B